MQLVRESISFQRYKDPKKALGLGFRDLSEFTKTDDFVDYIIEILPVIFPNGIPEDIICVPPKNIISPEYYHVIVDFYRKYSTCIIDDHGNYIEDKFPMWVIIFRRKMKDLGYKNDKCNQNESISFQRYKDPKKALGLKYVRPKYKLKDFPGLEKAAEDFMKFDIMDSKRDPGYGYEHVIMFLIRFTDEYDGEYGLCIWDTQKKEFIEEPSTLEDYGITTEEKFERKLRFEVPEDLKFELDESISFQRYKDPKNALFGPPIKIKGINKWSHEPLNNGEKRELLPDEVHEVLSDLSQGLFFRYAEDHYEFKEAYPKDNNKDSLYLKYHLMGQKVSYEGKTYYIPNKSIK